MNEKVELFRLSFTVMDKVLLLKDFFNKNQVLELIDEAINVIKQDKIGNDKLAKAYEMARVRVLSMSFDEIVDYIKTIR